MARPSSRLEESMRKYNRVIACERTPFGAWKIMVETPHDQIHIQQYFGYTKKAAMRTARTMNFDSKKGLFFNESFPKQH